MNNKSVNIGLDLLYNPHKVKQNNTPSSSLRTYQQDLTQLINTLIKKYPDKKNSLTDLIHSSSHIQKIDQSTQTDDCL
jgi:hypothetical protein